MYVFVCVCECAYIGVCVGVCGIVDVAQCGYIGVCILVCVIVCVRTCVGVSGFEIYICVGVCECGRVGVPWEIVTRG